MERKLLIASEFKLQLHPDTHIYEFMQMSDKAAAIREERRKAVESGHNYHG